ncbi:uncharacterized protein PHACADRAFT_92345, partial [Phanerochaete carnosa HHB-10118-sp]
ADFLIERPGKQHLLATYIGSDTTTTLFGSVYDYSDGAHNVSAAPVRLTFDFSDVVRVAVVDGARLDTARSTACRTRRSRPRSVA